jgi:hypothetical protein
VSGSKPLVVGAEMMRTLATSPPVLATVMRWIDAREGAGRSGMLLAVDDDRGLAREDDEDLLLVALRLVVLVDAVARPDLDHVHPERLEADRAPR